jgi:hypothetical protein
METVLNDAFNPGRYANHIPTNMIAKNNQIITIITVAVGLIVMGVVVYKIYELNVERESRKRKI